MKKSKFNLINFLNGKLKIFLLTNFVFEQYCFCFEKILLQKANNFQMHPLNKTEHVQTSKPRANVPIINFNCNTSSEKHFLHDSAKCQQCLSTAEHKKLFRMIIPTTFIMQYTISAALFCMTQQNLSSVSALLSTKNCSNNKTEHVQTSKPRALELERF